MPRQGEFAASIRCDGVDLQEYDVQAGGEVITCWVTSEAGKEFSIICENHHEYETIFHPIFRVHTDGVNVRSVALGTRKYGARALVVEGSLANGNTLRRFTFTPIAFTDDEAVASIQKLSDLGEIRVEVHREVIMSKEVVTAPSFSPKVKDGPVHERSKKMGVHRIGFSSDVAHKTIPIRKIQTQPYDRPIGTPFITFIFKYRPRELLQAQGILLPSAAPGFSLKRSREITPNSTQKPSKRPRTGDHQILPEIKIEHVEDDKEKLAAILRLEEQKAQIERRLERLKCPLRSIINIKKEKGVKLEKDTNAFQVNETNLDEVVDLTGD